MNADFGPAERLHPLAVLSGFGKAVRQMAGAFLAGGFVAFQGRIGVAAMIVGGFVAFILVGLLLHWLRFSFRVGEDAVRIDSGIVSRNHRTIPFDRVADVSIAQGPVQRLFGVAKVTLETGSSSAFGGEEGVLGAVALPRAEALRDHVRARRAGTASASSAEPSEDSPPLFAMDTRRVLTAGLFNFSFALFAGLVGLSQTVGNAIDVNPFERDFWEPLLVDSGLGEWLLAHRFSFALGGLALLIAVGVLTGLVRTLLREWNYRLERTGNGFRRRRGLLTRTDVSLPRKRIQAGVIATGPIRERFGWRVLKVQSLASDTTGEKGEAGDHVLAPLARLDELERIAADLGWALPNGDLRWNRISKAHVWSFCLAMLPLFPLLLLLGPLQWLEWKRTAYALDGERLLVRTGWWQRRTLILPLKNVQTVDLVETALSRRFGTAHLVIGIAGGGWAGERIPSLPRKEASLLRAQLLTKQP